MCFELDSEPPVRRIAGAAVSHEDLLLASADGARFAAFLAEPDAPAATGIVILPDVRGLYAFYEELALRFAERGSVAIAFDYFGRTAGVDKRPDDWDYMSHVRQTTQEGVQHDVGACVAELRRRGARAIFSVGFCFGGRHSWLAAAARHGLAGAVGFYGMPASRESGPGPLDVADRMECPILALQAGDDQHITAEVNEAFDAALSAAGVEHEVVTYPRAPHSFFDRKQEQFADASEDAWRRVLEFVDRYAASRAVV
jgi:carboxymethylenebutenolidase